MGRVTVIFRQSECNGLQNPRKVYRGRGDRFCMAVVSVEEKVNKIMVQLLGQKLVNFCLGKGRMRKGEHADADR